MPDTPMRGRRGRDRRIAERVATDFAARHAPPADDEVDFDVAAVDAEVEDARRAAEPPAAATTPASGPQPAGRRRTGAGHGSRTCPRCRRCSPRPARSPRSASGWARPATTAPDRPPRRARRRSRTARSRYLAAALALAADGERLVWIARDAEIGDRVAEELGAWLGDPDAVAVLEPRTALAYERSELVADETAARVAALAAWRSGRARILVASVQALLQHTIAPDDLPDDAARAAGRRAAPPGRAAARAVRPRLRAGRSRSPAAASSRAAAASSTSSRRRRPLPIRIEFFGDEIDSLRAFDPTDQRTVGTLERGRAPARVRVPPAGGRRGRRSATGSGRGRGAAPGAARRGPRPVRRRRRPATAAADAAERDPGDGRRRRRRGLGAHLAPATGLDHLDPGTLLVLDEPGDIAEAAEFLWRQADERRAELVEAGELPKDWPSTYLPPRDWKGRLVASRTLELTWESEPPEDAAMAARRPVVGRPVRLARAGPAAGPRRATRRTRSRRWQARRRPDRPRLGPGAAPRRPPRRGRPSGRGRRPAWPRRRRRAPSPSSSAASTAASPAARTASPSSPTASCSGPSASAGPKALRRVVPRDILERLTPGDLVVHIDHGVARYEQMLRRGGATARTATTSSCRSRAATGSSSRSSRSAGSRATRAASARRSRKLGGTEWLRTKQRVRKAVDDLAEELLALYAARADAPGPRVRAGHAVAGRDGGVASRTRRRPTSCARSPRSRPTWRPAGRWTGWSSATSATARPRSRCGPRSRRSRTASRSRSSSRRRSSPRSTIATFGQRFAAFPLEVRLLSRFVAGSEQATTLDGPRRRLGRHRHRHAPAALEGRPVQATSGSSSSTRSSASASRHKERLKQLRREVDVLTLSATPIPRTLNLALAGIRDLSVIETPPEDRLPIQTRVAEASAGLVRDAILRELDRGGQVFYVHNRVETIEAQAEQLRRMLPGRAVRRRPRPDGRRAHSRG